MSSVSGSKNLLIIDTDGGTDDCHGILIAASDPSTDIVAITCVVGNVDVDQVCQNVLRTVCLSDKLRKAKCPIYKGASKNLAGFPITRFNVHGDDGLGDAGECDNLAHDLIRSEPACQALVRLVNLHPGKISIAAIGPLTNLALAVRIDPTFPSKVRSLFIMGGDTEGRGNITPCAEFNFCADPEAAHVVLHEFECPKTLISWELTMKFAWDIVWMNKELLSVDTKAGRFLRDTHGFILAMCLKDPHRVIGGLNNKFPPCDQIAISVCINPSLITGSEVFPCSVEVGGVSSRGHLVIDRGGMDASLEGISPTKIVTAIDFEGFKRMSIRSVEQ